MRYDYKTIHPCGPHDVEMWISFLLDPNEIILKENVLRDFKFKRRINLEEFRVFSGPFILAGLCHSDWFMRLKSDYFDLNRLFLLMWFYLVMVYHSSYMASFSWPHLVHFCI